jgi:TolA-binding protein
LKYGDGKGPAPLIVEASRTAGGPQTQAQAQAPSPAASQAPAPAASATRSPGGDLSDAAKDYYEAVSFFSSEKYKEALVGFKRIVEANADPEYAAKASFDMGRCLFMLQQYELAVKHYTALLQSYPKHPDLVDVLYYLGQSYEKKGDADRAKGFYKKILSMEPDEDASVRIKATRALRKLEEGARG